jgi:hypothetical protein
MTGRDLGGGLVLRTATPADVDALVTFNAAVHGGGPRAPDPGIAGWTRDLLTRLHPTFRPEDFTLVEDTRTGAIVSSLNLIGQMWAYAGIPFGVGRVELVGTHPDYRRRGLVRQQFDVIHAWSAARGHLAQAITGIPWYYRQFGYEYALALDGGRTGYLAHLPSARSDKEPMAVRPATPADIPFIIALEARARGRYLVTCVRDEALWRYELEGRSAASGGHAAVCILEWPDGRPAGFLVYLTALRAGNLVVRAFEVAAGVPWEAAALVVLRHLRAAGEESARRSGAGRFQSVSFMFETDHPVYRAIGSRLPRVIDPYAWYVRVPDLPAFLRRVAPALEARLAASEVAGYTGDLRLNFYRDGLRLAFTEGRLMAVEPWAQADLQWDGPGGLAEQATASFPERTFLQLLFGHRSLDELRHAFPDCRVRDAAAEVLLNVLFPKQPSFVWPVS